MSLSAKFPVSAPGARIVLYSHDTVGYGHLRRNLLLARQLTWLGGRRAEVMLIAGMHEAGAFEIPEGVDLVALPAYAKQADGSYRPRQLGTDLGRLRRLRSALIKAAIRKFDPDLVIVDNVPRGAQGELEPALNWLRSKGRARVVLGLRDVIDDRDRVRAQWLRQRNFEALNAFYDDVWIYGDRRFFDLVEEYRLGDLLAAKASFTGYLNRGGNAASATAQKLAAQVIGDDPRPYVLCSVGGGRDGVALCEAFARTSLPPGRRGILVTGAQMPEADRRRIAAMADDARDLTLVEFLPELTGLLAGADRVVTMGGYNTICEVLSLRKTALVVPRIEPRREQILRAERLARRGLIDMLHPEALSAAALADWLAQPSAAGRGPIDLDLNGLARIQSLGEEALGRASSLAAAA